MPARDMAAYMRARRARQRAEREAAEPLADATIPRGALLKESAEDLSTQYGPRLTPSDRAQSSQRPMGDWTFSVARISKPATSRPPPVEPRAGFAPQRPPRRHDQWSPLAGGRGADLFRKAEAMPRPPDMAAVSTLHPCRRSSSSDHDNVSRARRSCPTNKSERARRAQKRRRQPARRHAWRCARARRDFQIRPDRARLE